MIDVPIQVKDALRDGRLRKNYRFVVLNEDGTESEIGTIDNNNLVSESVSIDERMCSGDTLKFGLCEGSSLEFQYFGLPNITGKRVQAFIDIYYGEDEPYTIPMGFFNVKKCSRQASTGIIKATCYNKLQSEYLDAKANELARETFSENIDTVLIYDLQKNLLGDYQIEMARTNIVPSGGLSYLGDQALLYDLPLYFTALWGIAAPVTAQEYWGGHYYQNPTLNTKLRTGYQSGYIEYNVPSGKWGIIENYGKLKAFESAIYERFCWIFETSKLRTTLNSGPMKAGVVTGQMMAEYLCSLHGFNSLFSIVVRQNNVDKVYSTIQWEYEEQNNLTHTVAGTLEDLTEITQSGDATIRIYVPYRLLFQNADTDKTFETYDWGDDSWSSIRFGYYTDSSLSSFDYITVHPIAYENGTTYINTTEDENITDAITVASIDLSDADSITVDINNMADYTLRDIVTASYETQCQFGQLSRITDLFSGVELNRSALYPADTLYPDDDLYPDGAQESAFRSQYSKLWADEGNVHKWKYLIITYKGLDDQGNETEYTLQRTVNEDGTDNYNCSDNWLFRNLVWTAEQIAEYADAMKAKMKNITWFPFEMWAAGLPYIETGDEIEITLGEETYTSYVLQRQLKGIQNLQDTYINGTLDIF